MQSCADRTAIPAKPMRWTPAKQVYWTHKDFRKNVQVPKAYDLEGSYSVGIHLLLQPLPQAECEHWAIKTPSQHRDNIPSFRHAWQHVPGISTAAMLDS